METDFDHDLLVSQMGTHSGLFDLIRLCGQIIDNATADRIESDTRQEILTYCNAYLQKYNLFLLFLSYNVIHP